MGEREIFTAERKGVRRAFASGKENFTPHPVVREVSGETQRRGENQRMKFNT